MYTAITMSSGIEVTVAIASEPTNSTTDVAMASRTGTRPAAIGRLRLTGCTRSSATSIESLIRYTAEAAMQNATKARPTFCSTLTCIKSPLASGAARTSTFFSHCRGRTALISPDSVVIGLCAANPCGASSNGEVGMPRHYASACGAKSPRLAVATTYLGSSSSVATGALGDAPRHAGPPTCERGLRGGRRAGHLDSAKPEELAAAPTP